MCLLAPPPERNVYAVQAAQRHGQMLLPGLSVPGLYTPKDLQQPNNRVTSLNQGILLSEAQPRASIEGLR
jgi:hypothetical protein